MIWHENMEMVQLKISESMKNESTSRNKPKLNINFFSNCKQLGVYPKFVTLKLSNLSNKDALSINERLLSSAINKPNKEHVSKELSQSKAFFTQTAINYWLLQP